MNDVNNVEIQGTVGSFEEVSGETNGRPWHILKVRVHSDSVDRQGVNRTNKVLIHIWNRQEMKPLLVAGARCVFQGMVQTREWEYEGEPRTSQELVARNFVVLGAVAPQPEVAASAK